MKWFKVHSQLIPKRIGLSNILKNSLTIWCKIGKVHKKLDMSKYAQSCNKISGTNFSVSNRYQDWPIILISIRHFIVRYPIGKWRSCFKVYKTDFKIKRKSNQGPPLLKFFLGAIVYDIPTVPIIKWLLCLCFIIFLNTQTDRQTDTNETFSEICSLGLCDNFKNLIILYHQIYWLPFKNIYYQTYWIIN